MRAELSPKLTVVKLLQFQKHLSSILVTNIGIVIVLTSDHYEHQDGIIRYNPGELLNKYQKKYNACLVDHSMGDSAFTLVIYKS